jgi:hypothetical protein
MHGDLPAEGLGFGAVPGGFDAYEDGKAELTTERLLKSVEEIVPLAYTMKEMIDGRREWAQSRARRASMQESEGKHEPGGRKLEI